jgi:hypothetical protein
MDITEEERNNMSRYLEADESLVTVFLDVMEKNFPIYQNLKFKLIFDTKMRKRQNKLIFATMELASEKIRFFSKDDVAVEGYDYILTVDQKAWELANDVNRERLMRHELRHVFIEESGKLKIMAHDVEDFREEIKLNADDPDWGFKLAILVNDVYEQEKEMAKMEKAAKKAQGD